MFRSERITDNTNFVKCDVESKAQVSPKFRKVDLRKIAEIQYLRDKRMYLIQVEERQSLPKQIIDVIGCESGYCIVVNDLFKIIGACMHALMHGYYSCVVLRDNKISLIHAPTLRVDKEDTLKVEDLSELEWDRDQL